MNLPETEDFAARRAELAAQIARQRGELFSAYQELEKPIRYTEYGMRAFGFVRQNPWLLTAVPAVFSLAFNFAGGRGKRKPSPALAASPESAAEPGKLSRVSQVVVGGARQLLRAYNAYRRVRSFFP